jgi:hypothetical protein
MTSSTGKGVAIPLYYMTTPSKIPVSAKLAHSMLSETKLVDKTVVEDDNYMAIIAAEDSPPDILGCDDILDDNPSITPHLTPIKYGNPQALDDDVELDFENIYSTNITCDSPINISAADPLIMAIPPSSTTSVNKFPAVVVIGCDQNLSESVDTMVLESIHMLKADLILEPANLPAEEEPAPEVLSIPQKPEPVIVGSEVQPAEILSVKAEKVKELEAKLAYQEKYSLELEERWKQEKEEASLGRIQTRTLTQRILQLEEDLLTKEKQSEEKRLEVVHHYESSLRSVEERLRQESAQDLYQIQQSHEKILIQLANQSQESQRAVEDLKKLMVSDHTCDSCDVS